MRIRSDSGPGLRTRLFQPQEPKGMSESSSKRRNLWTEAEDDVLRVEISKQGIYNGSVFSKSHSIRPSNTSQPANYLHATRFEAKNRGSKDWRSIAAKLPGRDNKGM